jgi:cyclopropane fatty-acyl-phospholipid synthase-like methyltransferase
LVAFAQVAKDAVGLDVSPSMLQEAQSNCRELGLTNVRLLRSDDTLSALKTQHDLIHSCIVFQHIPLERGREIFRLLVNALPPRGIGAFHFLYSKTRYADTNGVPPTQTISGKAASRSRESSVDPEIQMNPYPMTEILFLMQGAGVRKFYADFTDHGGELGLFIFFQVN